MIPRAFRHPLALASAAAFALAGSACSASLDDPSGPSGEPSPEVGDTVGAERAENDVPGTISEPPDAVATVMASGLTAPGQTFTRGQELFWLDTSEDGTLLFTTSVDGGLPSDAVKLAEAPFDAAIHDEGLYLTARRARQVRVSDPASGDTNVVAMPDEAPLALELAGEFVYWSSADGCVYRTTLDGDDTAQLACGKGTPVSIAIGAERVVWSTIDGFLYSTLQVPTKQVDLLASGESFNASITADDERVYWANHRERDLRSIDLAGGQVEIMAQGEYDVSSMTQGRFFVYFTTHSDGSVKRLHKGGRGVEVMVAGQADPSYISQNDDFLFWANEGDGTVARLSKW